MGISTSLQRNLNEGKEYNKLIPQVKCERINLGSGDTYMTVEEMKEWIEKYSFQTKKLAPKLKGQSIQTTVTNVYQFLYGHIQYQADGALQQLRSPACTWKQRKQGVDCKSYSIFASSILSNLGIKHFIRQIKQASFYPQEFTHVYIVIPVDQHTEIYSENTQTIVLDATKHQNIESNYIEKVDVQMVNLKHIGLNAPQDERTQNIIENFEAFSKDLLANGIPLETVNSIRERVNFYTNSGIDPKVEIIDEGIVIQGKLFVLNFSSQSGLGIVVTTAVTAGIAVMKMIPPGFINDTFGALFANKFNLSCWNSATSPAKATKEVAANGPELYKLSGLENAVNIQNINKFSMFMQGYIDKRIIWSQRTNRAQCTLDGDAAGAGLMEEFYGKVMREIRNNLKENGYKLVTASIKTMTVKFPLTGSYFNNFSQDNVKVSIFKIENDENFVSKQEPSNTTTGDINPNNNAPAKSNTGLIIGGVALASLPFLFMLKNQKPAKKNTK